MASIPIHIPKNFFNNNNKDVFNGEIKENHDIEQYFWTSKVVKKITKTLLNICIMIVVFYNSQSSTRISYCWT